jgi:hypothetical protein
MTPRQQRTALAVILLAIAVLAQPGGEVDRLYRVARALEHDRQERWEAAHTGKDGPG